MKSLAVLVGAVTVAVFATAALSGNAGLNRVGSAQVHAATIQQQVTELRNELICLETVAGDEAAADGYWASEAAGTPKAEQAVADRGVCKKLGVTTPGTTPIPNGMSTAFKQLVARAFGR